MSHQQKTVFLCILVFGLTLLIIPVETQARLDNEEGWSSIVLGVLSLSTGLVVNDVRVDMSSYYIAYEDSSFDGWMLTVSGGLLIAGGLYLIFSPYEQDGPDWRQSCLPAFHSSKIMDCHQASEPNTPNSIHLPLEQMNGWPWRLK